MTKEGKDSLFAYLEAKGVLSNGSPEDIAVAKREYRRDYERRYKRRYRLGHFEVRFTLTKEELQLLKVTARKVDLDKGNYAKEATMARLTGTSYRSETRINGQTLQLVSLIHSEVRHLIRQRPTGFLERRIVFDQLQARIAKLEETLRESLGKMI